MASSTPRLIITDFSNTGRNLLIIPNCIDNTYNPIVQGGDVVIDAEIAPLTLTINSSNTSGIRINTNEVVIGAGGTNDLPSQYIDFNGSTTTTTVSGTTLTVNNTNVNFTSTNAPTSSASISITDNTTKIPTTAWVNSAINNSININPSYNSVTINTNPSPSAFSTTGLINNYNLGAIVARSGTTTAPYSTIGYYPTNLPVIQFITNNGSNTFTSLTTPCLFELNCFFYLGSNYGETTCKLLILPAAIQTSTSIQNWGTQASGNGASYYINNSINGATSFSLSPSTYTPYGRQYWTYDQTFTGSPSSKGNGFLQGCNVQNGIFQIEIVLMVFTGPWTWSLKCLSSNAAQLASMGIFLSSSTSIP